VLWNWGLEQDRVIATLKHVLTNALVLVKIIYINEAGKVILVVNTSLQGWGTVLM
jgi:hypothetical protein